MSTKDTYRIAIVGPQRVITVFAALGVEIHSADDAESAARVIRTLIDHTADGTARYAVVAVMEDLLEALPEKDYVQLTRQTLPAIVAVPSARGSTGFARQRLRACTIRAIGSDLM